jgi:hypothetical protein
MPRLPLIVVLGWALAGAAAASAASGFYTFASAPGLHPPKLEVIKRSKGLARGDFLVADVVLRQRAASPAVGQRGPMILNSNAQPIWFQPVGARQGEVLDFAREAYDAKPVLVWSQGHTVVVIDQHYRTIATLKAQAPWSIDGHEATIVGGDIWVTVTRLVPNQNLSEYGGPAKGTVIDSGVQEYKLRNGHLILTWDALNPGGKPHVPLSDSEQGLAPGGWDAYHVNSIQPLPDGDLLVSMRNTSAVYLIDPVSGRIVWTLGGKRSSFTAGPGAEFAWQHDARLSAPQEGGRGTDVRLTLFNDNCCGITPDGGLVPSNGQTEAMVLDLNTIADTATLEAAYPYPPSGEALVMGSMQLLPGGNALVGWGALPYFTEYSPSGTPLLEVEWPGADRSYRASFTGTWFGTPYYPPSGAVRGMTVYASWNGATQVARWEVLARSSSGGSSVVAEHVRTGFETAITLGRSYDAYAVRALGARGKVLATSRSFS